LYSSRNKTRNIALAENVYEGLFILNSNRYARDPIAVSAGINSMIESQGGTILVSRLWEERRLAYPIDGQRKGTYWLTYFRLEGKKIAPLNQLAGRQDDLLRHLVIRIDSRIVETLVSHAQQTMIAEEPTKESKDEKDRKTGKSKTGKSKTGESETGESEQVEAPVVATKTE
jgi:small subunit ribosomal protein S6